MGQRFGRRRPRANWSSVMTEMGKRGRIECDVVRSKQAYLIKETGRRLSQLTVDAMLRAGLLVPVPDEEWDLCRHDSPEAQT